MRGTAHAVNIFASFQSSTGACVARYYRPIVTAMAGRSMHTNSLLEDESFRIKNYHEYFSPHSLLRQPSAIRDLQKHVAKPGMISLGGGSPNPATFPWATMTFKTKEGVDLKLTEEETVTALQYSATPGLAKLRDTLQHLQKRFHHPQIPTDIAVTTGSQEALSRAFEMLLGPSDSLLVENPTYSGSLAFLNATDTHLAGVATDERGLIPESLSEVLETWDATQPAGRTRPRVLYTVPTGANPSGGTIDAERRQRVYAIARRWGLLILEDDPYFFLQFGERVPSYLSMDTDGRVLRFDSVSKVLSSGLRVGFATGPAELIERMNLHTQAVNLHPSGLSQMCVLKLLLHWGDAGFDRHIASTVDFYRAQRDAFLAAASKHLTGLAEWHAPDAGMFVWIKLLGVEDSRALIADKAVAAKVLLVPGIAFTPVERGATTTSPYVRAAYSTATLADMDEALRRLGELLRTGGTV
eukprot:m.362289 g.362289  ORF g.362289 m.362289 type:complete len:469 (-) comp20786_c1_seq2:868-2274(-)